MGNPGDLARVHPVSAVDFPNRSQQKKQSEVSETPELVDVLFVILCPHDLVVSNLEATSIRCETAIIQVGAALEELLDRAGGGQGMSSRGTGRESSRGSVGVFGVVRPGQTWGIHDLTKQNWVITVYIYI